MIGFVAFLERFVGLSQLSLAQRVFAKTLDGEELATDEERAMFRELFALEPADLPTDAGRVTFLLKGSRCGGTLLCASFGLYRALTADLSQLRQGERCFVAVTGSDVRIAREALAQAGATIDRAPEIAALVVSRSTEKIELRRPHDGRVVVLQCLPATPSAPRGRWFAAVLVTEADYLGSADGAAPAEEVVRAYAARLLRGGKLLAETTPWAEGYWSNLFASDFGAPKAALVCRAPTLTFFPTPETHELVARERRRDPISAAREFDCAWVAGSSYFDREALDRCIVRDRPLVIPPEPGDRAAAGLDAAFRGDACGLVVARFVDGGVVEVTRIEVRRPDRGALVPSVVLGELADIARAHGVRVVCSDGYALDTVREVFVQRGIQVLVTGTNAEEKGRAYAWAKEYIHSGRARLPAGELVEELRAVVAKPTAGGGLKISSPRTRAGHGDVASAFVHCVYALRRGAVALGTPTFVPHTPRSLSDWGRTGNRSGLF